MAREPIPTWFFPVKRPGLALFLCLQGIFLLTASGWVGHSPDELEVYYQTESLVDRHSLAIPQVPPKVFFGKPGHDGEKYAPYGPLAAFLALPHHLAGRAIVRVAGVDRATHEGAWRQLVAALTSLATGTAAALACLGLRRASLTLGASERRATGLALVLGTATVLWPYATSFFSEVSAAAALTWAGAFLLERNRRGLFLAAGLLAVACLTKATNVFFALPLALAPLGAKKERAALPLLLGVALAGLVHMEWNTHRFGDPFDLGYDWGETIQGTPRTFALASLPRGLAVLLLSPGKSILVWAPAIPLLALPRLRFLDRTIIIPLGAAAVAGLLAFGAYLFPEGGYCHGPRNLVPIVPLLLLPAALGPPPSRRLLALALVLGVALNGLAVLVSFKEDQAWGVDRDRTVYYERIAAPTGFPENRYRLSYLPEVTLPRRAIASIGHLFDGEPEEPGTGLNLLRRHMERMRSDPNVPYGEAPPQSVELGVLLAGLLLTAFGAMGLGRTLLRKENAAILPA